MSLDTALASLAATLGLLSTGGCNPLWGLDQLSYDGAGANGGNGPCEPGLVRECYSGPAATQGVGSCRAGTETCLENGTSFGPCQDEVTPGLETCGPGGGDTDCDGRLCGDTLWALRFGGAGDEVALGVASDSDGDVLCTGYYQTGTNFGPQPADALPDASGSDRHGFVAKLGPNGDYRWSVPMVGPGSAGYDVAVDPAGNVYVVGLCDGAVAIGGTAVTCNAVSDVLVLKLDPDGAVLWARGYGGTGGDAGRAVAVMPDGGIAVVGAIAGAVDLGGGPLASAGGLDVFVALYDADGNHLASKSFGSAGDDDAWAVAVDAAGNLTLAGTFRGSFNLFAPAVACDPDCPDAWIAQLGPGLAVSWAQAWRGPGAQRIYDIASAPDGNLLVAGSFETSLLLPSETLNGQPDDDLFLAKLSPTGADDVWDHTISAADLGQQRATSVAVAPDGSITLGGYFQTTLALTGVPALTGSGERNRFVARFAPDGTALQARSFVLGSAQSNPLDVVPGWVALAVDPGGFPLLGSFFDGVWDAGGNGLASAGAADGVVLKLQR
jgi:hypothetical protein